jgi:hypothetical protein
LQNLRGNSKSALGLVPKLDRRRFNQRLRSFALGLQYSLFIAGQQPRLSERAERISYAVSTTTLLLAGHGRRVISSAAARLLVESSIAKSIFMNSPSLVARFNSESSPAHRESLPKLWL